MKAQWKRILIWILVAVACGYCSYLTLHLSRFGLPGHTTREFFHACEYADHTCKLGTLSLKAGQTVNQSFTAGGNIVGYCSELYLELDPEEQEFPVTISVELWNENTGSVLAAVEQEFLELPEDGVAVFPLTEGIVTSSGGDYCLKVTNLSETRDIVLCVNDSVQSGTLSLNGEELDTFLNFGFLRASLYAASSILKVMILLTNVTVLAGLALVLFTDVKEHILYLVLAVGFGIVTLFDLTPLYGFDMKFQFDSTYVLSNELLGLEGDVYGPSETDPERNVVHYYRRSCDDYSLYQFQHMSSLSDNYVDVAAGLKQLRVDAEDAELKLVESHSGGIGEQLYLYLPAAVGFAIARLLGLGFIPMLELGRLASYSLFVLAVFLAIRFIPFGKRLLLVLALVPTVMTQTVSITRDGTILAMSFFLIGKVLQVAYGNKKPGAWDWCVVLAVSAILAPCKMVYLPLSFFWLLIIYRQYIYNQNVNWTRILLRVGGYSLVILSFFVLTNIPSIVSISQAEKTGVGGTTAYSLSYILTHLPQALMIFVNTLRQELGLYLVNAIQLFEIDLGSSDTMTVWILLLLFVESCSTDEVRKLLLPAERYFGLLVFIGVFLLTALASMQWTSIGVFTIMGLQGRYLTPVLPLMCMALMNSRIRIEGDHAVFVKGCCCIFPAVYLMNMYLWTILQ